MSDDNEVSAEMPSELVQVLWETLAELYGSASVYPCDDIRRMAHDITTLRAERDAANAQLEEAREQIDVERYERDALREFIEDLRMQAVHAESAEVSLANEYIIARIDAALNKGGKDE